MILEREDFCDITCLLRFLWSECRVAIHSAIDSPGSSLQYLLENIINFIGEHISEDLSCSRLAGEFGVSANYISQLFYRGMKCGVSEYVQNQRMELARQLLRYPKMNIAEVADYCGYKQANYFIKVYKKQYGCTPLLYRIQQAHSPSEAAPRNGT